MSEAIVETVKELRVYRIKSGNKWAEITFENGAFAKCEFCVRNKYYTLDDWRFLWWVSGRIVELADVDEGPVSRPRDG